MGLLQSLQYLWLLYTEITVTDSVCALTTSETTENILKAGSEGQCCAAMLARGANTLSCQHFGDCSVC